MKKNNKITNIKINFNNKKRVKIFINHQIYIETDDTVVKELDLYIGKEVSDQLVFIMQKKEALTRAKKDSIHYLSYRPRSEWEITDKLKSKKYQLGIIEKTIQWLKENNLINDQEFSLEWIKYRLKNKPSGKLKLQNELYNKGIDRELIERTLNDLFENEEVELELAYRLIKERINTLRAKNIQLESKKAVNLLKNRGFSCRVINHIYDELFTQ